MAVLTAEMVLPSLHKQSPLQTSLEARALPEHLLAGRSQSDSLSDWIAPGVAELVDAVIDFSSTVPILMDQV